MTKVDCGRERCSHSEIKDFAGVGMWPWKEREFLGRAASLGLKRPSTTLVGPSILCTAACCGGRGLALATPKGEGRRPIDYMLNKAKIGILVYKIL